MFTVATAKLMQSAVVGVLPTDTVYGLVARAFDPAAVARLYQLKSRESKPGTVIAASIEQLVALGIKRRYLTAVSRYWPGAVSVVVPCSDDLAYLHLGLVGLAVRIPDDGALLKLLETTGPLLTSSANHPGKPTAVTVAQAQTYFASKVDFYEEGGDLSHRRSSTVIRIVDDAVEVLRAGTVSISNDV